MQSTKPLDTLPQKKKSKTDKIESSSIFQWTHMHKAASTSAATNVCSCHLSLLLVVRGRHTRVDRTVCTPAVQFPVGCDTMSGHPADWNVCYDVNWDTSCSLHFTHTRTHTHLIGNTFSVIVCDRSSEDQAARLYTQTHKTTLCGFSFPL